MNFNAKNGKIIVINGIVHAISGARIILDIATYIRAKGTEFSDDSSPVKRI
jgi:hypothetical protein